MDSITIPDYSDEIGNLNDSILNLQSQIGSITIPDYTNATSNLQSQIDIQRTNYIDLKEFVGIAFTSLQAQISDIQTTFTNQVFEILQRLDQLEGGV
jgi:hypothetical protein